MRSMVEGVWGKLSALGQCRKTSVREALPVAQPRYHFPPASLIAFSSARFEEVRRWPALRGRSGSPISARRLTKAALNAGKSTRRPAHSLSVFKRFDAMIAHRLFTNTPIKIHAVDRRVKHKQLACLIEQVSRGAGCPLPHPVSD